MNLFVLPANNFFTSLQVLLPQTHVAVEREGATVRENDRTRERERGTRVQNLRFLSREV